MEPQKVVYSDCEVRGVIRCMSLINKSPKEIHAILCSGYGNDVISIQMIRRWRKIFIEEGRTDVHDMPRSGRPSDTLNLENVQQLRDLLEEDRRMTISELHYALQSPDCSRASVGRI